MKKKMISLLVGMTLVAGLFLTGCGDSSANAKNLNDTENAGTVADDSNLNQAKSITIAVIGGNSLVINADRLNGFVQDAVGDDIEINYEVFQSGAETLTALQSGTVDIVAGTGALPVVNFASNGSKFVIVAATVSAGDSYIVATPESGITSLEDLKGKQVAVALGTGSHYLLLAKLAEAGVTIDDIEVANLGGPDALTAFVGGEVDVQVNSVSLIQPIVSDGSAVVIAESDESYSYVEANVDFAAQNAFKVSDIEDATKSGFNAALQI